MNGTWKEKVGGWNHKDSKRKTQKRRQTLKDKGRALLKVYDGWKRTVKTDTEVFRTENEQELVYNDKREVHYTAEVSKVQFSFPKVDSNGNAIVKEYGWLEKEYKTLFAYIDRNQGSYNPRWREEKTGLPVDEFLSLNRTQSWRIDGTVLYKTNRTVNLDWEKVVERNNEIKVRDFTHYNHKEFIYGQPLYRHVKWSWYNDGKRRKYAQKLASSKTRSSIRNWLAKKDYEQLSEPRSHYLEKSIAWEIW